MKGPILGEHPFTTVLPRPNIAIGFVTNSEQGEPRVNKRNPGPPNRLEDTRLTKGLANPKVFPPPVDNTQREDFHDHKHQFGLSATPRQSTHASRQSPAGSQARGATGRCETGHGNSKKHPKSESRRRSRLSLPSRHQ